MESRRSQICYGASGFREGGRLLDKIHTAGTELDGGRIPKKAWLSSEFHLCFALNIRPGRKSDERLRYDG